MIWVQSTSTHCLLMKGLSVIYLQPLVVEANKVDCWMLLSIEPLVEVYGDMKGQVAQRFHFPLTVL